MGSLPLTGQAVPRTVLARPRAARPRAGRWPGRPEVVIALAVIILLGLSAVFADWLAPYDPLDQDLARRLRPPAWQAGGSFEHLLGTDSLGRDLLSRLVHGGRVSLLVGLAAVAIQSSIGVVLGLQAGYYGGHWDSLVMRLADLQLAVPTLILAIAVIAVLGPSLTNLIIVLGITNWVVYGRVVRGEVLAIRRREYVEAARAVGAGDRRIVVRHVLPNVAASIIVITTLEVAQMIIAEASLSFLGLGVQPPTPSWGGLVAEGRAQLGLRWWLATLPGLLILATALALNLLGDSLRDRLDPTLRRIP